MGSDANRRRSGQCKSAALNVHQRCGGLDSHKLTSFSFRRLQYPLVPRQLPALRFNNLRMLALLTGSCNASSSSSRVDGTSESPLSCCFRKTELCLKKALGANVHLGCNKAQYDAVRRAKPIRCPMRCRRTFASDERHRSVQR